jgi:hypothetical protein
MRDVCTEPQQKALKFAAWTGGSWPRAKETHAARAIRSYRILERRGFVVEIKADARVVDDAYRLHFVATDAGRQFLEHLDAGAN